MGLTLRKAHEETQPLGFLIDHDPFAAANKSQSKAVFRDAAVPVQKRHTNARHLRLFLKNGKRDVAALGVGGLRFREPLCGGLNFHLLMPTQE